MSFVSKETPPCPCPHCGKVLDQVSAAFGGDYTPKTGDITMCVTCGEWSQFDVVEREGVTHYDLVKPTEEALEYIGTSPEARKARDVWVKMDNKRKLEKVFANAQRTSDAVSAARFGQGKLPDPAQG